MAHNLVIMDLDDEDAELFLDVLLFVSDLDKFIEKYPDSHFERYMQITAFADSVYKSKVN